MLNNYSKVLICNDMRHTDEVRILYTTTDSADIAYLLAETIVKDKLAACCTIIPGAISFF